MTTQSLTQSLIGLSGALLLALPAGAATLTFSDSTFTTVATDWSIAALSSDQHNGTLIPVTSLTVTGVAGELHPEMVVGDHSDAAGGRMIVAATTYSGTTFNPSVQGAINTVDFSADAAKSTGADPYINPVLLQGGNYYVQTLNFRNSTANLTGLLASDWGLYTDDPNSNGGLPGDINYSINPDFSATGGEIAFGFLMGGASSTGDATSFTVNNDLDNFSVTLDYVPEPGSLVLLGLGGLALGLRRRRTR